MVECGERFFEYLQNLASDKWRLLFILFNILIGFFLLVFSIIGIVDSATYSEFTGTSSSLPLLFSILPILLAILALGIWVLHGFDKKWLYIISVIGSIFFAVAFLTLMILTSIAIPNWIPKGLNEEMVAYRIQKETEVCFIFFLIFEYQQDINA